MAPRLRPLPLRPTGPPRPREAAARTKRRPEPPPPDAGERAGRVRRAPAPASGRDGRADGAPPLRPPRRPSPGDPDARMTPAVRRLLREHGLTAAEIVGTGGGGRITREDVIDHVESGPDRQAGRRPGSGPGWPLRPPATTAPSAGSPRAATPTPGRVDRVPGRRGRSPRPDDPDAQGHRRPDDPRAGRAARVRPDGSRRHHLVRLRETGQARLPGPRRPVAQLRAVRGQGGGRGAASATRRSTPTGPTTACWPSAGSTSASRSPSTTGSSCR